MATKRFRSNFRSSGFSLLELVCALTILVVGALALMATFLSTMRLADESRELAVLTASCRNMIEALKSEPFKTLPQNFGPSTVKSNFWSEPSGAVCFSAPSQTEVSGTIEFFNNEGQIPSSFADLAGGFDLNGNGSVDSTPVTDYKVLPGRIVATLNGKNGQRSVTLDFILTPCESW